MQQTMKIFSGNSNLELSREICNHLDIPLGDAVVGTFSDGEIMVQVNENVRGRDCFVVQSTCHPVNRHLMELLIMIDALKRASAGRITAVLPYYGYARQDRKVLPRVPITAKLVADLLTAAGANRVLTMDLHAGQIQGFFNIPVDNLYAAPILAEFCLNNGWKGTDTVVVSPDAGGVLRARSFAKRLHASLAIIDKRRSKPNEAKVMNLIGDVVGKKALILDDMVDTAGTLAEAANAIMNQGAESVSACCSHGILSGPALTRISESRLDKVVSTNSIPFCNGDKCGKVEVLSVGKLFAKAIRSINEETSVSRLFD
ncbi:MAG: ribose-phosphate pyrophosphokinase [Deltaproteobacteria bacterium]|nr:ribose-phosphate pyrophosphokinase [Deltaproteobacteria bacterium]